MVVGSVTYCSGRRWCGLVHVHVLWKLSMRRGVKWCTIPYHTIPYHTIPYQTRPYHTIPYHTIPYHTIPYHTIPYPMKRTYVHYTHTITYVGAYVIMYMRTPKLDGPDSTSELFFNNLIDAAKKKAASIKCSERPNQVRR